MQFHLNDGAPVAMSIPATEHSVMTAWHTEREAMENMIEQFGSGLLACVMDSYDYVQVCHSHQSSASSLTVVLWLPAPTKTTAPVTFSFLLACMDPASKLQSTWPAVK